MAKTHRFTFVCDTDERQLIAEVATRLQRSQSDAIRWIIRRLADEKSAPVSSLLADGDTGAVVASPCGPVSDGV